METRVEAMITREKTMAWQRGLVPVKVVKVVRF